MLLLKIVNNSTNLSIDYFMKIACRLYQITLKKKIFLVLLIFENLLLIIFKF